MKVINREKFDTYGVGRGIENLKLEKLNCEKLIKNLMNISTCQ